MKIENLALANQLAKEINALQFDIKMLNTNPNIGVRLALNNCPYETQSALSKAMQPLSTTQENLKAAFLDTLQYKLNEHLKTLETL